MTLESVETPFLLVDYGKLLRNIVRMQQKAHLHGIDLRPHAKTHKTAEIAQLQLRHGACGITASRAEEAMFFLRSGCPSVTVAYPMLSRQRLRALLDAAAEHGAEVRFTADSREGITALADTAVEHGSNCGVFLKIDTGLHRCGLQENSTAIEEYALRIAGTRGLIFAGLLSHAGHAYAAGTPEEIQSIAEEERSLLLRIRTRLENTGIAVDRLSVGSTPTALAGTSFAGLTELRPGNYVFLDGTQVRLGVCTVEDVSLCVVATVISRNDRYYIVDAGSKTLSSDLGAHGTAAATTYGTAYTQSAFGSEMHAMPVVRLSEEHGFLHRNNVHCSIGDKVYILPNHACPVANLAARLYVADGGEITDVWPVGARNMH